LARSLGARDDRVEAVAGVVATWARPVDGAEPVRQLCNQTFELPNANFTYVNLTLTGAGVGVALYSSIN
jgi:hypothetical protein